MSRKRHRGIFDPVGQRTSTIATLARDYRARHVIRTHFHDRGQLVYASRGVMVVRTAGGTWVVPTHRAVWIPAATPHSITMSGTVAMRTLYLARPLAGALPKNCCVVNVSPILRELILHACAVPALRRSSRRQGHVIAMIADQLETIEMVPLQLPNPADARALRVAAALIARPADRRPLARICRAAGASKRTIERLFENEVGMTLGKWRQQLRLLHALRLLAEGAKVTHAALEAGYNTPSAFISMFRRALGTTPRGYFGHRP